MTLLFSTETTGDPIVPYPPIQETQNWPRLIRLAWVVCNDDGQLVRGFSFTISPEHLGDEAGLLTSSELQDLKTKGHPLEKIVKKFLDDYDVCQTMVAHDLGRHYGVLAAEAIRVGARAKTRIEKKLCTKTQIDEIYPDDQSKEVADLWFALFGNQITPGFDIMVDLKFLVDIYSELKFRSIL